MVSFYFISQCRELIHLLSLLVIMWTGWYRLFTIQAQNYWSSSGLQHAGATAGSCLRAAMMKMAWALVASSSLCWFWLPSTKSDVTCWWAVVHTHRLSSSRICKSYGYHSATSNWVQVCCPENGWTSCSICIACHYQNAARLGSAGLTDVPIESQTAESTVTTPVIAGRQYNRSVRSHKIVGEALERFRQSTFLSYESTDIAASDFARVDKVVLELPSFNTKDILLQADSSCLIFNRYEAFWKAQCQSSQQLVCSSHVTDWTLHLPWLQDMLTMVL